MIERQYIERADTAVIGAGVVGLSIAHELAKRGREVFVFEKENTYGSGISSRSSEVIHSGLYYSTGSLKAKFCLEGKLLLYKYCDENGIPNKQLGKIIVATSDNQVPVLENLKVQGERNGVTDLVYLTPSEVNKLEPDIKCVTGLFSPSTGIVDSRTLMTSLRTAIQKNKSSVMLRTEVVSGRIVNDGIVLSLNRDNSQNIHFQTVINSAGLDAQNVAASINGFPKDKIPIPVFVKGHYFLLKSASHFSHLIYPIPEADGLGIHVTLDFSGQVRFGPDTMRTMNLDYTFHENRAKLFYEAIRKYFPSLEGGSLVQGYTGVRPKISNSGANEEDFVIQGYDDHGIKGLFNLFGIESPGLTSALALAKYVGDISSKL